MMRLPNFRYQAPATVAEAAAILSDSGPEARLLAGGTDLLPNMKRRQQTPGVLIGLRNVKDLHRENGSGSILRLGAGLTLAHLVESPRIRRQTTGLWQAAAQIATPQLRNMGTMGGNLCLDTRCAYYDQNEEWRRAIQFCMKKDGQTCWVAPRSRICLAISSTDTAPALISLGARVRLVSVRGERELPLEDLYRNDGMDYMTRQPDEILTEVILDTTPGWRSTYWKLRRRGSFDFPVLSVAAAVLMDGGGVAEKIRIVLGAVAMRPLLATAAAALLKGKKLTDDLLEQAAASAAILAKPMDNTDFTLHWRKEMARRMVVYALRELRGDDVLELRRRLTRQALLPVA
ncbi:MAG: FAD binding domain-containing protein [Acidobacteriota bacterium]